MSARMHYIGLGDEIYHRWKMEIRVNLFSLIPPFFLSQVYTLMWSAVTAFDFEVPLLFLCCRNVKITSNRR